LFKSLETYQRVLDFLIAQHRETITLIIVTQIFKITQIHCDQKK